MSQDESRERFERARRRALRAAKVVTLGLALAGCAASHEGSLSEQGDAAVQGDAALLVDAGATMEESSPADGGPADGGLADGGLADGGLADGGLADGGGPCVVAEDLVACCEAAGWPCDADNSWGCCAWGPYVPPGESLPPSRSASAEVAHGV
jgi:hypothetical protein